MIGIFKDFRGGSVSGYLSTVRRGSGWISGKGSDGTPLSDIGFGWPCVELGVGHDGPCGFMPTWCIL